MPLRSTLAGRFRQPGVILAEIGWRWVFGASSLALLAFAGFRLEHAIVIDPGEQQMLSSGSPIAIAQAILEIAHRVQPLAVHLVTILVPAILLLWVVAVTVGRGYVLVRIAPGDPNPRWLALLLLNLLRALSLVLLAAAYFGSSFVTSEVINPAAPNYAFAILVFLALFGVSLVLWSFLNWILSISCIYATRQNCGVLGSLRSIAQLIRRSGRELMSASAQNSSIRTVAAIVFTFLALPPLATYRFPTVFWTLEILIFLVYCVVSDILLLSRFAVYVEVTERVPQTLTAGHV